MKCGVSEMQKGLEMPLTEVGVADIIMLFNIIKERGVRL